MACIVIFQHPLFAIWVGSIYLSCIKPLYDDFTNYLLKTIYCSNAD